MFSRIAGTPLKTKEPWFVRIFDFFFSRKSIGLFKFVSGTNERGVIYLPFDGAI